MTAVFTLSCACLLSDIKDNDGAIIVHLWIEATPVTVSLQCMHEPWPLQRRQINHLHEKVSILVASLSSWCMGYAASFDCDNP